MSEARFRVPNQVEPCPLCRAEVTGAEAGVARGFWLSPCGHWVRYMHVEPLPGDRWHYQWRAGR